jgi:hypothetical protein
LAVPGALGPVYMFCTLGIVFGGTKGVRSHFHVICSRTNFRPYCGRHVSFSCFALPDSFSTATRASGPVFMFCSPGLFFSGTEGVPSHFHDLRSSTCFRRYRGRRVHFSCFALPDSFSAVPRALGPFFMFSLSDSFSAVPSVSGPLFIFCAPDFILDGTDGV